MDLQIISESRRGAYARERMAHFADRCRQGGLAVTPQRLAIIEALLDATDHPRAETVFEAVRRLHPHISLATVHRTLETLCQIGEARKVTTLHDSARYDGQPRPASLRRLCALRADSGRRNLRTRRDNRCLNAAL